LVPNEKIHPCLLAHLHGNPVTLSGRKRPLIFNALSIVGSNPTPSASSPDSSDAARARFHEVILSK
jgi:hypothetical protein